MADHNSPDLSVERREPADVADVVLTPHVARYSEESIGDLRRTLARDVRRVLTGEAPVNPVDDQGDLHGSR